MLLGIKSRRMVLLRYVVVGVFAGISFYMGWWLNSTWSARTTETAWLSGANLAEGLDLDAYAETAIVLSSAGAYQHNLVLAPGALVAGQRGARRVAPERRGGLEERRVRAHEVALRDGALAREEHGHGSRRPERRRHLDLLELRPGFELGHQVAAGVQLEVDRLFPGFGQDDGLGRRRGVREQ